MAKPKILNNFTTAGEEAKKMLEEKLNGFTASGELKKTLEEKYQERMKIFGYIGMESYDLYRQHKIAIPQMDMYFEKLQQLEKEITELEAQKQKMEQEKKGIVCVCGQTIKKDMTFCPRCGRNIQKSTAKAMPAQPVQKAAGSPRNPIPTPPMQGKPETSSGPAPQKNFRECICGARVPAGQKMCMECGRIIGG